MRLVKAVTALKLSSHEHFLVPTLTFSLRTSRLAVITEIDLSEACMHDNFFLGFEKGVY